MSGASGKYRLDARLGGGGMAEVFVGSSIGAEGFSRRVAIKRVLPGFSDNEAFAQMLVDEAQISSHLVHPNIVSVIDFDRDPEQRLFLVMELVEGKDLDALVGTGALPVPVVIFVISEVLRGLGYAHDLPVAYDGGGGANIRAASSTATCRRTTCCCRGRARSRCRILASPRRAPRARPPRRCSSRAKPVVHGARAGERRAARRPQRPVRRRHRRVGAADRPPAVRRQGTRARRSRRCCSARSRGRSSAARRTCPKDLDRAS